MPHFVCYTNNATVHCACWDAPAMPSFAQQPSNLKWKVRGFIITKRFVVKWIVVRVLHQIMLTIFVKQLLIYTKEQLFL